MHDIFIKYYIHTVLCRHHLTGQIIGIHWLILQPYCACQSLQSGAGATTLTAELLHRWGSLI